MSTTTPPLDQPDQTVTMRQDDADVSVEHHTISAARGCGYRDDDDLADTLRKLEGRDA